jgi:elongation factor 1-alpha
MNYFVKLIIILINGVVMTTVNDNVKDEICIVTAGSVDCGKTTFIGVLSTNELDDGRGKARNHIARHPHEIESGRTSDISVKTVQLSDTKEAIMVDLCGHEKYLKTTLFGITGYFPDYAIIFVAANRGLLKMTREHMGILLYMRIPFIILITRIDISPPNIYENTVSTIRRIMRNFNKKAIFLNSCDELQLDADVLKEKEQQSTAKGIRYAKMMAPNSNIVPIISISNKTGYYFNVVREILLNLEPRKLWNSSDIDDIGNSSDDSNNNSNTNSVDTISPVGTAFYIDSKFIPSGVGLVVSGILKGRTAHKGDELLLGPYEKNFVPVRVWSIHNNDRQPVTRLNNRQRGCFAIRCTDKKIDLKKDMIRKGMLLITENMKHNICYEFKSSIKVLNHSTTISHKYSPVIHCGTVRQSAQIILEKDQYLKTGESATVSFRFLTRPEYMEKGTTFFFREGTTRGVGVIEDIVPIYK